ncbi:hypothetical protein LZL87_005938 [Fusarium oxysporum]|nr:hypothetical protein LZL87_005938 [Fusarium oxysporum]
MARSLARPRDENELFKEPSKFVLNYPKLAKTYLSIGILLNTQILFLLPSQISPLTFPPYINPSLHPSIGDATAIASQEKSCRPTITATKRKPDSSLQPPRKRPKLTHNAATTPSVTKPKSVLDGIALIAEVRLNIYHQMVAIESTNHGFERDHLGRFLCPIDATGLAPYLNRSITKISGLRQEYLVEVFRLVVFIFTSSEHLKLFSEFIRSHFNLDPAQVPRLQAKVNFFHNDSFPQGVRPLSPDERASSRLPPLLQSPLPLDELVCRSLVTLLDGVGCFVVAHGSFECKLDPPGTVSILLGCHKMLPARTPSSTTARPPALLERLEGFVGQPSVLWVKREPYGAYRMEHWELLLQCALWTSKASGIKQLNIARFMVSFGVARA